MRMTSDMTSDSALGSRALACHNIFTDLMTSGLGTTSCVMSTFDIYSSLSDSAVNVRLADK